MLSKQFFEIVFSAKIVSCAGPNQSGYGSNWNWNMPQNGPAAQGGPPATGAPGPQGTNNISSSDELFVKFYRLGVGRWV